MIYFGSCHCNSVKFKLETNLDKVAQCNCSFCKRRGAKLALEKKDAIEITEGEENLTSYQFNTKVAKHHFCKKCGIQVYSNRRFDPNGIGVNLGCIDAIDPFEHDAGFVDMKNK